MFRTKTTDPYCTVICHGKQRIHGVRLSAKRRLGYKKRIILPVISSADPDIFPPVLVIDIRPDQIQMRSARLPDVQHSPHSRAAVIASSRFFIASLPDHHIGEHGQVIDLLSRLRDAVNISRMMPCRKSLMRMSAELSFPGGHLPLPQVLHTTVFQSDTCKALWHLFLILRQHILRIIHIRIGIPHLILNLHRKHRPLIPVVLF